MIQNLHPLAAFLFIFVPIAAVISAAMVLRSQGEFEEEE